MADEQEELELEQPAGLRPFWTGTITFGLVTVPVSLYTASRPRSTALRMIGPDDAPVQRRYVCSKDGKPLDLEDLVRGYEIEKETFVVVTDEELEAIEPRKSREIDLQRFVDRDSIDPIYFERAYFLVPAGNTNKAYRLLAEVMEKKGQAGIATFVMRTKEYLVAILAEDGILRAETLRFPDDVRSPDDIGLPAKPRLSAADVKKVETQIARHSKKFDPKLLQDDYAERLEKLAMRKAKSKSEVVRVAEEEQTDEGAEVVDLMAVLSRSLGAAGKRKPALKAPLRKRAGAGKKKRA